MEFERKDQLQLSELLMSFLITPARLILQGTSCLSRFTSEPPAVIYGAIKLGRAFLRTWARSSGQEGSEAVRAGRWPNQRSELGRFPRAGYRHHPRTGAALLSPGMCDARVGRAEGAAETKKNYLITQPICSPPVPV